MSVRINGNGVYSRLWLSGEIQDDATIASYTANPQDILWGLSTVFLASFQQQTLEAGNIEGLPADVTGWEIYRYKTGDSVGQKVGTVLPQVQSIRDYVVGNQDEIQYGIATVATDYVSNQSFSSTATADFWQYSLTDVISREQHTFVMNVETGSNNITSNQMIYQGFGQFPKIAIGQNKYKSGSITCLIGDIDSNTYEYVEPISKRESLIDFLNNGNNKVLKNMKGDIFVCQTKASNYSIFNKPTDQPTTLTFEWTECDTTDDLSVFDTVV